MGRVPSHAAGHDGAVASSRSRFATALAPGRAQVQLHDISLWDQGWCQGLGVPSLLAYASSQHDLAAAWAMEHRAWRAGRAGHGDPSGPEVAEVVLATRPRLVGFTLTIWSVAPFAAAIRQIRREQPDILIAVGGPLVAGHGGALLGQIPEVDFAVQGYGEAAFAALLRALTADSPSSALANVPGLFCAAHRSSSGPGRGEPLPLAALPSPLRAGLVDPPDGGPLHVEWSRGCPGRCGYCSWGNAMNVEQVAGRDRILDDIRWAAEHGLRSITLSDAAINFDTQRLAALCATLVAGSREAAMTYHAFLRYEHVDDEQLRLLRQVDFASLTMGLQSDDPPALAAIGRPPFDRGRFTWVVEQLAAFTRVGVQIISGLPGDRADRFHRRLALLRRLPVDLTVFPLQLPPGSRMYRDRERLGLQPDPQREYFVFSTDHLTAREHEQCLRRVPGRPPSAGGSGERPTCGVSAPAAFWRGLAAARHSSKPLVQLHHANLHDGVDNFGLGVPFLIAHARAQTDLAERYELLQECWEVDSPSRYRCSADDMVAAIVRAEPLVAGFSLQPWSFDRFIEVLQGVKQRRPAITIVVGGPNATIEGRTLLEEIREIDFLVFGEGEQAFAELLRALALPDDGERQRRLAGIGNLWARVGDALVGGPPRRELPDRLDYCGDPLAEGLVHLVGGEGHLNLEWTRGCPNSCAYCAWPRGQRQLRRFSPARIAADLRWATAQGFEEIVICDAAVNYELELLQELCGLLASEDWPLRFACFVHWLSVDELQAAAMAPVRWSRLMFGLQTDDDAGLRLLGRPPFDRAQLERCVELLRPLAMPHLELITGIPGDTAAAILRRVDYALSLGCCVSMFPLFAARGSRLRQRCLEAGAQIDPVQHVVAELPTLPRQDYQGLMADLERRDLDEGTLEIAGYDFLGLSGGGAGSGDNASSLPARGADAGEARADPDAAWSREHARLLREQLVDLQIDLAAGWRLTDIRAEPSRLVLVVQHSSQGAALEFLLAPRDDGQRRIAHSERYNLGLIWERPGESRLSADQSDALLALLALLGMRQDH